MRVALASFMPPKAPGTATHGAALLDPAGPFAVLGWDAVALAAPIVPSATSLFGARGVCLHPDGSFWVCDTGHHRLLGWHAAPERDNLPADLLVGQPDFSKEGRNAKGEAGPATLNVPTGVAAWGAGLAVADAWNHRVLLWREVPRRTNQPADIILGQAGPGGTLANRGADHPSASTLNWPYGVAELGGRLVVADTGNRRVLVWNRPERAGQPADLVLGQPVPTVRDENAGHAVGDGGMRWPHGLALWAGGLAVSDAGNNRIMLWDRWPRENGQACDRVIGQAGFSGCDHNGASYFPDAAALNMPYAIAAVGERMIAADTANSRLVAYSSRAMGAVADRLTGQPDFASKGDNGWGLPGRDTLCWPYGLSVLGDRVAVADSGNNRVLLWRLARDLAA